jgi:hypothetical protein
MEPHPSVGMVIMFSEIEVGIDGLAHLLASEAIVL